MPLLKNVSSIKVDYKSISKQTYNEFCKRHPHVQITFQQYRSILNTYNKMFRDYVVETGDSFKLPHGFGEILIWKWKKKKIITNPITGKQHIAMAIDWVKSKQQGKHIYILNNHTDGFRMQWKWLKSTARFELSEIYVFKPTRESSRKISEAIKKNPHHYHFYQERPYK